MRRKHGPAEKLILAFTALGVLLLFVTVAVFVASGREYVALPMYAALGGLAGWAPVYVLTRSRSWGRLAAVLISLLYVADGVAAVATFPGWLAGLSEQGTFVGSFAGGFASGVFVGAVLRVLGFREPRREG